MTTTAVSVLNTERSRQIQRQVDLRYTIARQFSNNRYQGEFDAGRLYRINRAKIGNAESDFNPATFNPIGEAVAIPTATNIYLVTEELNTFEFAGKNLSWDVFNEWFGHRDFRNELQRKMLEQLRIDLDKRIWEGYRANGGTPIWSGTDANNYVPATGDPVGLKADILFTQVDAYIDWLDSQDIYGGTSNGRPIHWVAPIRHVRLARNYFWSENKNTPNINEFTFVSGRFEPFRELGYEFTYNGVNIWSSSLLPEYTPASGTNSGKKNWTSFGFVGADSYTRVTGPTLDIPRGPSELGTLQNSDFIGLSVMVDDDEDGWQYVQHTRKEA